ncbi:MAG: hypothetical protein Q7S28_02300 [bacterium]|nr:hypothetical protein [bacterium]
MSLRQWCLYSFLALAVIVRVWFVTRSMGITILAWVMLSCLPVIAALIVETLDYLFRKALRLNRSS